MQEDHYYPFGMKQEGSWTPTTDVKNRYQYNGIEHSEDLGLNVNFAFYRTLDPSLGRWWGVDPAAESYYDWTPYNAMGDNPITISDPNGDFWHIVAGAAIGGVINLVTHWDDVQKGGFWAGVKAFGAGAVGGAMVAATGPTLIGAGAINGFAIGAASSMAGDAVTQAFNGIFFGDQPNVKQNLGAGLTGGVLGAATGVFTLPKGANPWTGAPPPGTDRVNPSTLNMNGTGNGNAGGVEDVMRVGGFEDGVVQIRGNVVGSAASSEAIVVTAPRVGPNITYLTRAGNYPSWKAVKDRYWQLTNGGIVPRRMAQVRMRATGEIRNIEVSRELHHINGRTGADPHRFSNLMEVWPWEHEVIDRFRFTGYDFIQWSN